MTRRLLSTVCGVVIVVGGVSVAQEPGQQDAPQQAVPRRIRPQPPVPSQSADPPASSQAAPVMTPQPAPAQFPGVRPQDPPPAAMRAADATPPTPEQLPPPTPPQVTYRNGMLTVQAMNCTLGGVLSAIRNKTGIQFEGLEGGANERVAISMGPAPEGEVLATILGGSKFDYVVLGRPDSPGTVQRVLLTPRGGAPSTVAGAQPPANAQSEDDEDVPEEQASGEPDPQDTPVRPPLTQAQQQPPQPQPEQAAPRTPEQLMRQLQEMQQRQQQQQQQQQGSSPPNQAPKPPAIPQ